MVCAFSMTLHNGFPSLGTFTDGISGLVRLLPTLYLYHIDGRGRFFCIPSRLYGRSLDFDPWGPKPNTAPRSFAAHTSRSRSWCGSFTPSPARQGRDMFRMWHVMRLLRPCNVTNCLMFLECCGSLVIQRAHRSAIFPIPPSYDIWNGT